MHGGNPHRHTECSNREQLTAQINKHQTMDSGMVTKEKTLEYKYFSVIVFKSCFCKYQARSVQVVFASGHVK